MEVTPVILARGSERNRFKITQQLIDKAEESSLLIRDNSGLTLFVDILKSLPHTGSLSSNLVSLDLRACVISITELNDILSLDAFAYLESISASLKQVHYFTNEPPYPVWSGNTPILKEPITPLPRLKSLQVLLIPQLSINSTPLAKLMHLSLNASNISLRDRDNSNPQNMNHLFFSWYTRHNFPKAYPNLKCLSISIYSEFLSAMLMESMGDFKVWFPALTRLILYAQSNYMKREDLNEYRNIFKDISVEIPPYMVS